MKLTETVVNRLQPAASRRWFMDDEVNGFGVMVTPKGHKAYHFRYGLAGRWNRSVKIGNCSSMKVVAAREQAKAHRRTVELGGDPAAERRQVQQLRQLSDLYVEHIAWARLHKRSWRNDDGYWRNHLLPSPFGKRRLSDIHVEHVAQWHRTHPKPVTANRCLEVLSSAFEMAREWGWCSANPCSGITHHPEPKRRRYASQAELRRVLKALDRWAGLGGVEFRFACLVMLLLVTGARLREVMNLRWSEVDWDRGVLLPPVHKTDHVAEREIQLGTVGLQVVQLLDRFADGSEWLIAGRKRGRPLSGYRRLWLRLLAEAEVENLRVHDLRRTFATLILSSGQGLEFVAELLGHESVQTTKRYAFILDDVKRDALDRAIRSPESPDPSTSCRTGVLPSLRLGSPSESPASSRRLADTPRP